MPFRTCIDRNDLILHWVAVSRALSGRQTHNQKGPMALGTIEVSKEAGVEHEGAEKSCTVEQDTQSRHRDSGRKVHGTGCGWLPRPQVPWRTWICSRIGRQDQNIAREECRGSA
jgi:hypothetical protein